MASQADEDYFNDLSKQPRKDSSIPPEINGSNHTDQSDLPKTKRIACVICRKRKLRCDGNRPKCATCARLGHNCAYDEARRKSGPKRGYVKELEARLGKVHVLGSDNGNLIIASASRDPASRQASSKPKEEGPVTASKYPGSQRDRRRPPGD